MILHSYGTCQPDVMNLSSRDVVLPVVPMFHVNAWSLAVCLRAGRREARAARRSAGRREHLRTVRDERVTFSAGVPTVWLGALQHMQQTRQEAVDGEAHDRRRVRLSAGADADLTSGDYGIKIVHAWGMTEMSPLARVHAQGQALSGCRGKTSSPSRSSRGGRRSAST